MKKLKTKIIKQVLNHPRRDCIGDYGFPQPPILKRHGMVFIGFDTDYFFLAYVDSKKWKTKKVKKLSQRCLFRHTYSDICKHKLKKHHEEVIHFEK